MSAPGTPKASQAAITAVQEALGCRESHKPFTPGADGYVTCAVHHRAGIVFGGDISGPLAIWTERGCPVAVAAADAAAPHNVAAVDSRVEQGPVWGRSYGFGIPVRIHPSEESARVAAADVTKGGTVVVFRNAENGWEEA